MTNPNAIIVEVVGNTWTAFGDPNNEHHVFAMNTLVQAGGINESIAQGTHSFLVEVVEDLIIGSLDPM